MARNSIKCTVILLAMAAILSGIALATVESTVPAKSPATEAKVAESSAPDDESSDDESSDDAAVEDQAGFNTLEDMLLFRGPLATLWAAPQSVNASVVWREVTPANGPHTDDGNTKE